MRAYNQAVTEDRRLAILRILADSPQYRANLYLVQRVLANVGHAAAFDVVKTDIAWLAEQGLAESEEVGGLPIPSLTTRGLDVACGRSMVPGVARPMPD